MLATSLFGGEKKTYTGEGFTFDYDGDLKLIVSGAAIKAVRVTDGAGNQIMVQNYRDALKKEALSDLMVDTLLKTLNNSEELKDKTDTRTIFEAERKSRVLLVKPNEAVTIEVYVYTFEHNANTYCVIAQYPLRDKEKANKIFAEIIPTIKETKE